MRNGCELRVGNVDRSSGTYQVTNTFKAHTPNNPTATR